MAEVQYLPYKVKDISLADWGRKEIELAELRLLNLKEIKLGLVN